MSKKKKGNSKYKRVAVTRKGKGGKRIRTHVYKLRRRSKK
jgi:hypothetical protein